MSHTALQGQSGDVSHFNIFIKSVIVASAIVAAITLTGILASTRDASCELPMKDATVIVPCESHPRETVGP